MGDSKFDKNTQSLWIPFIDKNKLFFKNKYGDIKESNPEDTLLYEKDLSKSDDRYINMLKYAFYNPINPIQYIEEGCDKCNNKYLKYIRIGDNQDVIYVCNCN